MQAEQLVREYLAALQARDFARARRCLADESFSYRSPIGVFDSADDFIADTSRVGSILERIECRRLFVDGDEVCAILDFFTRMDRLQITPLVQWTRVRGDRIEAMETFFDAREYARMFELE